MGRQRASRCRVWLAVVATIPELRPQLFVAAESACCTCEAVSVAVTVSVSVSVAVTVSVSVAAPDLVFALISSGFRL